MPHLDFNLEVSGLLADMAASQTSVYARRAYERSARAVSLLEVPLPDMPREVLDGVPPGLSR